MVCATTRASCVTKPAGTHRFASWLVGPVCWQGTSTATSKDPPAKQHGKLPELARPKSKGLGAWKARLAAERTQQCCKLHA